ncbi:MAG: metallopeptidase family protein [Phycisphaerales bacterium]|nr:metallopeptidase family protein [Phycisphaerales bacterium]
MRDADRARFDELFEAVFNELPEGIRERFEAVPVVLDDVPDRALLEELACDADDLCGLHTGVPITHRSVEDTPTLPDVINLYRVGIVAAAGGWSVHTDSVGLVRGGPQAVREEIRVTLLHELGHHFGLDEDDLERLGYQ